MLDESHHIYDEYLSTDVKKDYNDVQQLMSKLYYESNEEKVNELLKELYGESVEYEKAIEEYALTQNRKKFIWDKLGDYAYGFFKKNTPTEAWNNLKYLEEKLNFLNSAFYTPNESISNFD